MSDGAELPGGLAAGKTRIFQVDLEEDGVHAVFEYYTEYGDQCVTRLRLVKHDGGLEAECWLPVRALLAFTDHFRDAMAGKFPSCVVCGPGESEQ